MCVWTPLWARPSSLVPLSLFTEVMDAKVVTLLTQEGMGSGGNGFLRKRTEWGYRSKTGRGASLNQDHHASHPRRWNWSGVLTEDAAVTRKQSSRAASLEREQVSKSRRRATPWCVGDTQGVCAVRPQRGEMAKRGGAGPLRAACLVRRAPASCQAVRQPGEG